MILWLLDRCATLMNIERLWIVHHQLVYALATQIQLQGLSANLHDLRCRERPCIHRIFHCRPLMLVRIKIVFRQWVWFQVLKMGCTLHRIQLWQWPWFDDLMKCLAKYRARNNDFLNDPISDDEDQQSVDRARWFLLYEELAIRVGSKGVGWCWCSCSSLVERMEWILISSSNVEVNLKLKVQCHDSIE